MAAGVLIGGIPMIQYYYLTQKLVSEPLPLGAGASLKRSFVAPARERYFADVVCDSVGPFTNTWKSNSAQFPCDIALRISHDGEIIHSERVSTLPLGIVHSGATKITWQLAAIDLPSRGRYDLELSNATDLAQIQITQPQLELKVRSVVHKDRLIFRDIGLACGTPVFLIGLGVFFSGGRKKRGPITATV